MIRTIAVCGAGTMGSGIAQLCAMHEFQVVLFDLQPSVLKDARLRIEENIQLLVSKNKLQAEKAALILPRIRFTTIVKECIADLVIEAIIEKVEAKVQLFKQLMAVNTATTIFATNTSSLSITAIAKGSEQPESVAGMHFFNPPTLMQLVEVVSTEFTKESVMTSLTELAIKLGKTPVHCQDAPGFIVNHVARPFYLESLYLVEKGIADLSTIDTLMEASGFKMGPFRLMDLIGNDINYAVSCSLYNALQQPDRLQPSLLQKEKVDKGELGKKSGKGYYSYEHGNRKN